MNNNVCKICSESFFEISGLHKHLKAHKLRIIEYYQTHYPRYDMQSGEIIKFKNKDQYFSTDFNSRENLKKWIESKPHSEVEKYISDDPVMDKAMIVKMPNITNIVYGRDVGYKVEQVKLGDEIEAISATQKRKELGIWTR